MNTAPARARQSALSTITRIGLMAAVIVSLSACGGNKKEVAAETSAEKAGTDITRPPQTIAGTSRQQVQERDPEETISFDEWRKRRLEELREQQTP